MIESVTSLSNPLVKESLEALSEGTLFALEGTRTLRDALDAGVVPVRVFYETGGLPRDLSSALSKAGTELVPCAARVVEKLSDLRSTRGAVALAAPWSVPPAELALPADGFAILLDGIQDPANVGAILRSAEAFGAKAALLTKGCASPFATKAFRASAGSVLRVPLATGVEPTDAVAWVRSVNARLVGADAHDGTEPPPAALERPFVLAVGSEGHGFSQDVRLAVDLAVRVPLEGGVESLNAAVAASVLLFALSRSRL